MKGPMIIHESSPEYWSKINPTIKPWRNRQHTQHQASTISSIDKSLSRNPHSLRFDPQKQDYFFLIWYDLQQAGSSFDEQMCIICQTFIKSKVSALGEDGSDKLLQAASDWWKCCDYGNIDVIDILRLIDLKHLNCAGKEVAPLLTLNIMDLVF